MLSTSRRSMTSQKFAIGNVAVEERGHVAVCEEEAGERRPLKFHASMRNDTDELHASLVYRRESTLSVDRIRSFRRLAWIRGRIGTAVSSTENGEIAFTVNSESTTKTFSPLLTDRPSLLLKQIRKKTTRRVARLSTKPTTKSTCSNFSYYHYSSSPSSSFRSQAVLCSDGAAARKKSITAYIAAPSSNASSLKHGGDRSLSRRSRRWLLKGRQDTDLRKKPKMVRENIAST